MDEKKRIPVAEADGWIPVQEGLPKKADYYLVTRGRKRITTMLYFTRGKWWSDSLCSILDWPDLWAFAPALEEEADAGSETDDEDTLMWHTNVVREKGEP